MAVEQWLTRTRSVELKAVQERGCVAAQSRIGGGQQGQRIEACRASELLCLGNAVHERSPGQDGLDRLIRIRRGLARRNQRRTELAYSRTLSLIARPLC